MKVTSPLDNNETLLVVARFGWQITMDGVEAVEKRSNGKERYRRWIV